MNEEPEAPVAEHVHAPVHAYERIQKCACGWVRGNPEYYALHLTDWRKPDQDRWWPA